MERQLFSWSSWDQEDIACLSFTGIELKKQIGQFPAGTRFDFAYLNFDTGDLQLGYNKKECVEGVCQVDKHWDFKLELIVKDRRIR